MMRLWVESYTREQSVVPVGIMSATAHALIIALWVNATLPAENVPKDSIVNRVIYIPPPDRTPGPRVVHEAVRYVESTQEGPGAGENGGPRAAGNARPAPDANEVAGRMRPVTDTSAVQHVAKPGPPAGLDDSVFSVLEVDTAVVRTANSAAPAYPLKLLESRIMGTVQARYVVDTTGFADTASFEVIKSSHPGFIAAVRDALPYMRFSPAKIGPLKVRQLVEQSFSFKITDTSVVTPVVKRP